jgi:dienelactone hydrolase
MKSLMLILTMFGGLAPGAHPIGFKTLTVDKLQVSVWYPAQSSNSDAMRYEDYFLLSAMEDGKEITVEEQNRAIGEYKTRLSSYGVPQKEIDAWFNIQMDAKRNAPALNEKFPLVLIAQGNFQSAHDQAIFSEYLATHGYVVATAPSPTRNKPMETEDDVVPTATQQANDLKFIISRLKEEPFVDTTRIGIAGHSFGARSALLAAFEIHDVKALVSLDGGIASAQGKGLIEKSPLYHPENFRVPILHIYEDQEEFMKPDFELLDSLKNSPRYLYRIQDIHHHEFSSFGLAAASIPGLGGSPALKQKWDRIATYTLKFLDAFVKEDPASRDFIEKQIPHSP